MAANHLVAATDEIAAHLTRRQRPTSGDLDAAAWIAWNTFRNLAADAQFWQALTVLAERRVTHRQDYDAITGASTGGDEPFQQFLAMERKLLVAVGMRADLVAELLDDTPTNVERLRAWHRESSPEALVAAVFAAIENLRQCMGTRATARAQRAQALVRLHTATHGVAGAAIIVVNGGALGLLSAAGTAVSGTVGATVLSHAAKAIGSVT